MGSQIRPFLIAVLLVCSLLGAVPLAGAQTTGDHNGGPTCSFPVSETDATGQDVTLTERPERIVVLQPSAAQTVWALGAEDRVVGAPVSQYTADLEGIENKTNVLNLDDFSVNREAVAELNPDLVLAPNTVPDETVEVLRENDGHTVFKHRFGTSLEFIAEKTARTGRLIDACETAETVNEAYWDRIESVETSEERPRVLHYSGGPAGGVAAGSGTFIDAIIVAAGGVNVAAEEGIDGYGELNPEAVASWDIDVFLIPSEQEGIPDDPAYQSTFAARTGQTVAINGNYLSQPAPGVAIAVEELAAALADAEVADRDTATETPDSSPTDAPADQPGFGPIVALGALLAAAFLASRR